MWCVALNMVTGEEMQWAFLQVLVFLKSYWECIYCNNFSVKCFQPKLLCICSQYQQHMVAFFYPLHVHARLIMFTCNNVTSWGGGVRHPDIFFVKMYKKGHEKGSTCNLKCRRDKSLTLDPWPLPSYSVATPLGLWLDVNLHM